MCVCGGGGGGGGNCLGELLFLCKTQEIPISGKMAKS